MAHFELRYPTESSPTASWVPTSCPALENYTIEEDDNTIADLMADGNSITVYRIGDPSRLRRIPFVLTTAEKDDFITFKEAVRGKAFRLKHEPVTGGFIDVRFAPEAFRRSWTVYDVGYWNGELLFWDV